MNANDNTIKTAPFEQLVGIPQGQSTQPVLDIIIEDSTSLHEYCTILIHKILQLPKSQLSNFINHQASEAKDPLGWLDNLDVLITENQGLFIEKNALHQINKLFDLIEKKRELLQCPIKQAKAVIARRYINSESEDRHFSFYEVKQQVDAMKSFSAKILFLTEEIFEHKQADMISINNKLQPYDVQCSHFIEKLQTMNKMRSELEKENPADTSNQLHCNKIQFNCNVNQFVDIFYQLSRELFIDGKPLIDNDANDIAEMIVKTFIDKDKNEISPQTVKTILKSSREDKRPKDHKRIDVSKLL